jgi:hypothetical protein
MWPCFQNLLGGGSCHQLPHLHNAHCPLPAAFRPYCFDARSKPRTRSSPPGCRGGRLFRDGRYHSYESPRSPEPWKLLLPRSFLLPAACNSSGKRGSSQHWLEMSDGRGACSKVGCFSIRCAHLRELEKDRPLPVFPTYDSGHQRSSE